MDYSHLPFGPNVFPKYPHKEIVIPSGVNLSYLTSDKDKRDAARESRYIGRRKQNAHKRKRKDAIASDKLMDCPICNRVFIYRSGASRRHSKNTIRIGRYILEYFDNLRAYGHEKKICYQCQRKEKLDDKTNF